MTEDSPRILLSTRIIRGLSGKVFLMRHNVRALQEAGWDVTVLAEKIDPDLAEAMGADIIRVRSRVFSKHRKMQRFIKRQQQLAAGGDYDLVAGHGETLHQDVLHIHNCRHLEYEVEAGKPLQPGIKETADIQAQQLQEQRYRRLVTNSHFMKHDFMRRFDIDGERVDVIYPGYDPQRFNEKPGNAGVRALRDMLVAGDNELLVGLITSGKLHLRGGDLLIPAIARLPEPLKRKLQILIMANDKPEPFIEQARQAGLAKRVHFLPPRQDVETVYKALDIYVNPARQESFGMTLLEAMACGVPCITTRDKVGASELFDADMQAGLMDDANVEALARTLQPLVESTGLREAHGKRCAQAARPHDWASNTRQHIALYERVLKEKQAEKTGV